MNTVFSVGPGVFTEDEFSRAVGELDSPDLEGWELLVESMGTKVYRKYREVRGSVIEEPHQHTVNPPNKGHYILYGAPVSAPSLIHFLRTRGILHKILSLSRSQDCMSTRRWVRWRTLTPRCVRRCTLTGSTGRYGIHTFWVSLQSYTALPPFGHQDYYQTLEHNAALVLC